MIWPATYAAVHQVFFASADSRQDPSRTKQCCWQAASESTVLLRLPSCRCWQVLSTLGSVEGQSVLELGAGIGRFTGELAKHGELGGYIRVGGVVTCGLYHKWILPPLSGAVLTEKTR